MALESCGRDRYDVIIIDIGLKGGIDGWTLALQLRAEGVISSDCVLVAMTGYGREEDIQRTFASGMNYHLTKPSDPVILKALLNEICDKLDPEMLVRLGNQR
ncbi:hypothetical protein BH11PLA2_BH11PLA2_45580 [soil metagenome]